MDRYEPEGWILDKARDILKKSHPDHFAELVLQGETATSYELHCFNSQNGAYFLEIPWPGLDLNLAKRVSEQFLARELPRKARKHGESAA
jgi:hypothetical protein